MDWIQYQNDVAKFFRDLGCNAEVNFKATGIRTNHSLDVWVRFRKFGLETRWIIECKYWHSPVSQEKVLALRSIVEDVGADRGILISNAGFQSGAIRAAEKTNITLTDFDELKKTAEDDLIYSTLQILETRATTIKYGLHDLFISEKTGAHSYISKPRLGVDGNAIVGMIGKLSILEFGFDRVRLKKPPYPVKFDDSGQRKIVVYTLEEFVNEAANVIYEAESVLDSNKRSQRS